MFPLLAVSEAPWAEHHGWKPYGRPSFLAGSASQEDHPVVPRQAEAVICMLRCDLPATAPPLVPRSQNPFGNAYSEQMTHRSCDIKQDKARRDSGPWQTLLGVGDARHVLCLRFFSWVLCVYFGINPGPSNECYSNTAEALEQLYIKRWFTAKWESTHELETKAGVFWISLEEALPWYEILVSRGGNNRGAIKGMDFVVGSTLPGPLLLRLTQDQLQNFQGQCQGKWGPHNKNVLRIFEFFGWLRIIQKLLRTPSRGLDTIWGPSKHGAPGDHTGNMPMKLALASIKGIPFDICKMGMLMVLT